MMSVLAGAHGQSPVKHPFAPLRTYDQILRAAETIAEHLDRFSMVASSAFPRKTMAFLARGCGARICGLFAISQWISAVQAEARTRLAEGATLSQASTRQAAHSVADIERCDVEA